MNCVLRMSWPRCFETMWLWRPVFCFPQKGQVFFPLLWSRANSLDLAAWSGSGLEGGQALGRLASMSGLRSPLNGMGDG